MKYTKIFFLCLPFLVHTIDAQPPTQKVSLFEYVKKGWKTIWDNPARTIKLIIEDESTPHAKQQELLQKTIEKLTAPLAQAPQDSDAVMDVYNTLYLLKTIAVQINFTHECDKMANPFFHTKKMMNGALTIGGGVITSLTCYNLIQAIKNGQEVPAARIYATVATFLTSAVALPGGLKTFNAGLWYGYNLSKLIEKDHQCHDALADALEKIRNQHPKIAQQEKLIENSLQSEICHAQTPPAPSSSSTAAAAAIASAPSSFSSPSSPAHAGSITPASSASSAILPQNTFGNPWDQRGNSHMN